MPFLRNIVLENWDRKLVSLFLAIVIWLTVNHSLTTTKTLDNVSIRLINIPAGMTVEGLQPNGMLNEKIALSLQGNKTDLAEITSNDIEVVLDATDKSGHWLAPITRKNLFSLNPDIDLSKTLKRVVIQRFEINFTKLMTEKLSIAVAKPVGEAPRDYQLLDIWPNHLNIMVSGPEDVIKQLKTKTLNLTFNLNDISRDDLESQEDESDEVSFYIPDSWKTIDIPALSDRPFEIDDPQASELRIDFVRSDLHRIEKPIPVTLFFPPQHSLTINPESYALALNGLIHQFHGLHMLQKSLYAKGVSRLFLELVQDMIEISIVVVPKNERSNLDWCVRFINPRVLEDKFVAILMSAQADFEADDQSMLKRREEYLRNRFRNYMNHFQLYKSEKEKFDLNIELQDKQIVVQERPYEDHRRS